MDRTSAPHRATSSSSAILQSRQAGSDERPSIPAKLAPAAMLLSSVALAAAPARAAAVRGRRRVHPGHRAEGRDAHRSVGHTRDTWPAIGRSMEIIHICNVHERRIAADPERVWDLLMTMSGPDDRLSPPGAPPLRLDGPLVVGARGGHGPIRYQVTCLEPPCDAGTLMFHFREPTGLVGQHSFHVSRDEEGGTLLRHEVVAEPEGWMRLKWPLIVRWIHDAVVEKLMDRVELATGNVPVQPHQRSHWVSRLLLLGAPRARPVPVPATSSACEALPRVDWADAYRMVLRPGEPMDPETWRLLMSDLSRRSRLLRLRIAGGSLLRSWTGAPGLGREGPFPVLGRTSDEILVGLDEAHLDFRAALALDRKADGRTELVVTTAVMCHNAWGRRYMAVIKPLHRRLVPMCMRRAAQHATTPATTSPGGYDTGPGRADTCESPA